MAAIDLKSLIARLDDHCRRSLEAAAGLTLSRSHYNVEIEHWLLKLADGTDTDIPLILRHYEIDHGRFLIDLNRGLDRMKTGNARAPALSPDIVDLAKQGWLLASIEHGLSRTRSGHLLWALLADEGLARRARDASGQLLKIQPDALKRDFAAITGNSAEAQSATLAADGAPAAGGEDGAARPGGSAALDQFTDDLTARARVGKIDPILGRDFEIRQAIDILTRRRQNNPIFTGEAGVGKTAVVEGLALKIAEGDVPEALKPVTIRTLDMTLLQAGAGVKGEFENRLKSVIDEVKASPKPIVLFIDEAHTLIGAGGAAGQNDAANILKPALARGELRTIAATTWAEYKKYFERDAALTRRFQVVKVEEPAEPMATAMIRGLVGTLEKHHKVRILDEAVSEAVRLSARYIPSRQLPDKAISLIDTACARVAMSQVTEPAPIEDRRRRIALIDTETGILDREMASGGDHAARRGELAEERAKLTDELAALTARFAEEKTLAAKIAELRGKLETPDSAEDKDALRAELAERTAALKALQGEEPLIFPVVDGQAVAEIVESWTGIPAGRMQSDEINTVLNLRAAMERRIVGQPHALEAVAQAIRTSRARLTDPRKPIGVFLMVGTSGTGKTETALTLADLLYGGEQNVTTINMTEFKEEHKVSLLMGSPPGYVGYGEGGVLTEAVRRRPYSVILLDEMEKAHPGVQDVFFQVFDKGNMKDGEGRDIDFKNTVIIMTSNAGTELIDKLFADPETAPDAAGLAEALRPELMKYFKPAFLGRVTLVPYFPLSDAVIRQIVGLQLNRIARRVRESYKASFDYVPELVETIAARCKESSSGARNVENILSRSLLPELSAEVLARLAEGETISRVTVGIDPQGSFRYELG
ncbi:type VI secretion system ATPase TssH [Acidiphilium sp. AL]|uniref:Type VI secretion system ATPase TssH n=1 Tax=Acidiphilium iwatense TaxID=768198 RepID=A0ABS9DY66_9PROT|nr:MULTISPECIES: type VI secretion system ATPase TssH [Acidiphilium]MCF3947619.1 type VI secretion system ATPase TssH [Acidiphilium iwatense]MCU4160785.1 type VI secretion system ATPase TssH [Acidiphilium sp. AL]